MAKWHWLLSAALVAMSSASTVQAQDQEDENGRPIHIDEIPIPAQDAIRQHVRNGRLMQVMEETGLDGEPLYEGHIWEAHGRRLTITVDAGGNIVELHHTI
jgi:hypothetical protein